MSYYELDKMIDYIIMDCKLNHKDNFISLNDVIEHRIKRLLNSKYHRGEALGGSHPSATTRGKPPEYSGTNTTEGEALGGTIIKELEF